MLTYDPMAILRAKLKLENVVLSEESLDAIELSIDEAMQELWSMGWDDGYSEGLSFPKD